MSKNSQQKPLKLGEKKDADDIIRRWSSTPANEVNSPDSETHWNVKLTPSVGSLTLETIQKLNPNTKVMISAINKIIGKLPDNQQNWEGLVSALSNSVIITQEGEEHNSSSVYTSSDSKWFGMVGKTKSPDTIRSEVLDWYNKLIDNSRVQNINRLNIDEAAEIVAYSAETISHLDLLSGKKYQEKEMIELGLLRYPDEKEVSFSIYKITLIAWSDWKKHMGRTIHNTGIRGVFLMRKYLPNDATINAMSQEIRDRAIKEVDEMLNSQGGGQADSVGPASS